MTPQSQQSMSKPAALSGPAETPTQQQESSKRQVTLPIDPVAQRRAVKDVFLNVVGASVLSAQLQPFVSDDAEGPSNKSAELFIEAIRESVQPRDALEEMLVVQMAWTHARLARLSAVAHNQEQRGNVQVVHDACDRAANTFRRQMLALAEYRRPPRQDAFVAIKQANVAAQQVVHNMESANAKGTNDANEQGSAPGPALPALAGGPGGATGISASQPAMAVEHGPPVSGGQGPVQPQRDPARRAERADGGGPAGAAGGAAGRRRRRKQ